MVRWLSPKLLLQAGREVVVSGLFAKFADKREVEAGLPEDPVPEKGAKLGLDKTSGALSYARGFRDADGALWFDYASDVGEGFVPTYTVAWLLAQEGLELEWRGERHETKRGRFLVLGGDQVYPSASWPAYHERFVGPYRAALPAVLPPRVAPDLYAIPGNHDWYDGLTSFMRLFSQGGWIGGWRTRQRRSYFALRLSEHWWLWAIDIQFDTYMDGPQLEYFRRKGTHLGEGDRVILATAKPSWVGADRDHRHEQKPGVSWETLNYVEEELIGETGARVAVTITGDKHHYVRYSRKGGAEDRPGVPRERITAGGGGAHTSATHDLEDPITLPQLRSGGTATYERRGISPTPEESLRMRRIGLGRIAREYALGVVIGLIYALLALSIADGIKDHDANLATDVDGSFFGMLWDGITQWNVILVLLLLAGLVGFTKMSPGRWLSAKAKRALFGLLHWAAHVLPAVALTVLGLIALEDVWSAGEHGLLLGWVVAGCLALVGWAYGRLVLALYLWIANSNDPTQHATEIYGGLASTEHKNFLRFRLDRDGTLTIYPIGVRRCPEWELAEPDAAPTDPWFTKPDDVKPERLIEAPIELGRRDGS